LIKMTDAGITDKYRSCVGLGMLVGRGIHALHIPFQVKAGERTLDRFVYCFTVLADRVTLIDTGVAGAEKVITAHLAEQGRDIGDVDRIILTHAHPDHIGAAREIQKKSGCSVSIHAKEKAWVEDPDRQNRERPVPGFSDLVGGPVQVDQELGDGMRIELGQGMKVNVIHTPGHSPGSCSFILNDILFSGDAIPVPGDLPIYDDFSASLDSLLKLNAVRADTLCMSWAGPTSDVSGSIGRGIDYLRRLDGMVSKVRKEDPDLDDVCFTKKVMNGVGLGSAPPLPLVTRSLLSHGTRGKR
jgi:glyoxylase-like metal-dependent hydrolase (beta-lactamase superfamily II)